MSFGLSAILIALKRVFPLGWITSLSTSVASLSTAQFAWVPAALAPTPALPLMSHLGVFPLVLLGPGESEGLNLGDGAGEGGGETRLTAACGASPGIWHPSRSKKA